MAEAISNIRFKEIYELSTEEKLNLVDLIIRSIQSNMVASKTKCATSWVDQFEGKWIDSKDADEMANDIRKARTRNTDVML